MKKIIWIITLILFSYIAIAQPPQTSIELEGATLDIVYPQFSVYKAEKPITLFFHVHNSTGYVLDNTTTDCILHVYNQSTHIVYDNMSFALIDFYYELPSSIYNKSGVYTYLVYCNNTEAGFVSASFEITDSGIHNIKTSGAPIFIGLVLILGIIAYIANKSDDKNYPIFSRSVNILLMFMVPLTVILGGKLLLVEYGSDAVSIPIYNLVENMSGYYQWFTYLFVFGLTIMILLTIIGIWYDLRHMVNQRKKRREAADKEKEYFEDMRL